MNTDAHGALMLSSRRMINLIRGLPSHSLFKRTAEPPWGRGGDFDVVEKILVSIHGDVAKYVASQFGEHYSQFVSAADQKRAVDAEDESRRHADAMAARIRARMKVVE